MDTITDRVGLLRSQNLSYSAITARLGITRAAAHSRMSDYKRKQGVVPRPMRPWTELDEHICIQMLRQGHTRKEVAEAMDRTQNSVIGWAWRNKEKVWSISQK